MCIRFSPDDRAIAAAYFDGTVVINDTQTLTPKLEWNVGTLKGGHRQPVTSLAFRPVGRSTLLVTCSSGLVARYDYRTGEQLSAVNEVDNELYCCDYRHDGSLFVTAGRDAHVRIYDDATGHLSQTFSCAAALASTPPAERIYSVKFIRSSPNLVIAAGWSGVATIFDIRTAVPVGTSDAESSLLAHTKAANNAGRIELVGPYLTGDALDVHDHHVFAASHRIETPRLTLWDLQRPEEAPLELPWPTSTPFLPECARFSENGEFLAVAGTDGQQVKAAAFVVERRTMKPVVDAKFDHAICSCHFAANEPLVAFADAEGVIHVYENRLAGNQHRRPIVA